MKKPPLRRSLFLHLGLLLVLWIFQHHHHTDIQQINAPVEVSINSTTPVTTQAQTSQRFHPHEHKKIANLTPTEDSAAKTNVSAENTDAANPNVTITRSQLEDYAALIVRKVNQLKKYPRDALFREEQGKVIVSISIRQDGSIEKAEIFSSSNFDSLNQAALQTIQALNPLPPIPFVINGTLRLRIPVVFEIQ